MGPLGFSLLEAAQPTVRGLSPSSRTWDHEAEEPKSEDYRCRDASSIPLAIELASTSVPFIDAAHHAGRCVRAMISKHWRLRAVRRPEIAPAPSCPPTALPVHGQRRTHRRPAQQHVVHLVLAPHDVGALRAEEHVAEEGKALSSGTSAGSMPSACWSLRRAARITWIASGSGRSVSGPVIFCCDHVMVELASTSGATVDLESSVPLVQHRVVPPKRFTLQAVDVLRNDLECKRKWTVSGPVILPLWTPSAAINALQRRPRA
jgi:hypothetical protein